MTLPPLPEPWRKSLDRTKINTTALNPFAGMSQAATPDFYTSAQMHAYATAAVLAEREACAKIAEDQDPYGDPVQGWFDIISAKIRERSAV